MMFPLVQDFADALAAMPAEHPRYRVLHLLDEAIRRDVNFIDRHPTTLFQCLWNSCWWYDCSEARKDCDSPESAWRSGGTPRARPDPKLSAVLWSWRAEKAQMLPAFLWLRSMRPPELP